MNQSQGVTFPLGFRAAGVSCGLKPNAKKDLALVAADHSCTCAGIFTRNIVKGHSLQRSQKNVADGTARAVVINSGNANACVGERGDQDAVAMTRLLSEQLDCSPEEVLPCSTGVIGIPLPMDKIERGIHAAVQELSVSGGPDAAAAIMTTDTFEKQAQKEFILGGHTVRIGAMAKGSGMIHPNMATMISVITTDCAIDAPALKDALKLVADVTYNRISVDGDTSVCDTVLILASGDAKNPLVTLSSDSYGDFIAALEEVCRTLSKMLASDGEGATKLLTIQVENAPTEEDAKKIAEAIAKSPLCKTAAFGQDANWGRILTAAGYSGADFDPSLVDIYIGDLLVCQNGTGLAFDEDAALQILKNKEVVYTIDLKQGDCDDLMWTCDFSYDYVKINGSYRT